MSKNPKALETKINAAQENLMALARAERIGVFAVANHRNEDGLDQNDTIGFIPDEDTALSLLHGLIQLRRF
jgi:hypothetical protein